jgi:hypothetical protein
MSEILQKLGYKTRVVAVFDTDETLTSHAFLEVMNPETGRWETQDPQLDIFWRNKVSGERVSLADAAEGLDAIEPCGRSRCGWDLENREGSKVARMSRLLDIISLTRKERGLRYALYTSRADLNRIYTKDGKRATFCEVQANVAGKAFTISENSAPTRPACRAEQIPGSYLSRNAHRDRTRRHLASPLRRQA